MQRGKLSGTATSAAPSSGTSVHPSRRAARAGYSAVRSGDDVKMALSTSSGWKAFASWSARSSSAVASRIAWLVFAAAVVAPRSPRRVLLMAPESQLRLMVITDARLLKGRDPVEACRRAVAGGKGATIIQVRLKDAPPRELLALSHALVSALAVPVIVNDRVDVALAAGAAGAHLGQEDPPLDLLRPHVPPGFLLGLSVGSPAEAARGRGVWATGAARPGRHPGDRDRRRHRGQRSRLGARRPRWRRRHRCGVGCSRPDRCGARAARCNCLTRWIAAKCSA